MGVTIKEMPMFNGTVVVPDVYCNVRQHFTDKMDDGKYFHSFSVYYYKDDQQLLVENISFLESTPMLNLWQNAYDKTKAKFASKNYEYVDS